MGGDGAPARGARARVRAWAARHRLVAAAGAVVAVLTGVTAALGGLAPAEPATLPERAVGSPLGTGPFSLRVDGLTVVPELGPAYPAAPGVRYVVVSGAVTGRSASPVPGSDVAEAVALPELPDPLDAALEPTDAARPDALLLEDGVAPAQVGAGLTYEVVWVYRTGAADLAASMPVQVRSHTEREDNITREVGWFDPTPLATVRVPVERRDG